MGVELVKVKDAFKSAEVALPNRYDQLDQAAQYLQEKTGKNVQEIIENFKNSFEQSTRQLYSTNANAKKGQSIDAEAPKSESGFSKRQP